MPMKLLIQTVRQFNLSNALSFKQKISYKQRYEWLREVRKSKAREPATSMVIKGKEIEVPDMIPEIVVPQDLEHCDLKPYVAWRAKTIIEPELTPERLYEMHYAESVVRAFDKKSSHDDVLKSVDE